MVSHISGLLTTFARGRSDTVHDNEAAEEETGRLELVIEDLKAELGDTRADKDAQIALHEETVSHRQDSACRDS